MTEEVSIHYRIMRNKKDEKYWVQVRENTHATNYLRIPKMKPSWFFGLWLVPDGEDFIEEPTIRTGYYQLGRYWNPVNTSEGPIYIGTREHHNFVTEYFDTMEDAQKAIDERIEYDKIDNTYEGDWQP